MEENRSVGEVSSVYEAICEPLFKDQKPYLLSKSKCEVLFKELTFELTPLMSKEECEALFKKLTDELSETVREPIQNESSRYLFDGKATRWNEWKESLISYTLRKNLVGQKADADTIKEEATDMVLSFLAWVCKKDKLAGRTGEEVKYHWVQSTMYIHWVTHLREKLGKDGHARQSSTLNKTQQERKTNRKFAISSTEPCSKILTDKDEITGKAGGADYWDQNKRNEYEEYMAEQDIHRVVNGVLEDTAKTEEEADLWKRAWQVIYTQKDKTRKRYETDQGWADDWGMPVEKVRRLKERVRKILAKSEEVKSLR